MENLGAAATGRSVHPRSTSQFPRLCSPPRPRVLVVDDEQSVRVLLRRILESGGYDPVCCASASEAKELISRDRFQAALCDLKMPGESGMELARWILETQPEVAVLMVSVVSDLEVARLALETGVYGYVTKPFNPRFHSDKPGLCTE